LAQSNAPFEVESTIGHQTWASNASLICTPRFGQRDSPTVRPGSGGPGVSWTALRGLLRAGAGVVPATAFRVAPFVRERPRGPYRQRSPRRLLRAEGGTVGSSQSPSWECCCFVKAAVTPLAGGVSLLL
jgi:hypothetical protein